MKALVFAAALLPVLVTMAPAATADPTLPPMNSTGGGPVIGGGGSGGAIGQQLFSFHDPNIQEVDGSDAAQFFNAATGVSNRDLAAPFQPLQRMLGCQVNGAGFGARAYRRNDGQWGGGMLVIAKSAVSDVDALNACAKSSWRKASVGTPTSMCNSGWTYPPFSGRKGEGYYVLLAGTNSDFCTGPNANLRTTASSWPT
ncbi:MULTISPECIES: hypothetical protein [Mycobacterium]|uniref:Secreted protein n=1 Tax=Mycobacterium kiyosense TaxID=2871094 RepID=A0A9P3UYH9_9MYCO|nr:MULTISPECIES: hypothetical protein [Mycobacterium]BDB40254.1 hypothetical protein IWGMT90018_07000 [Mycobacterium kiyosense]BDE12077.1 hypothetical protein MKCMC460_09370 [Mycobacterium sp. 20KCMC460]GLB83707.1 hypothetical protein SRL2020028_29630 [Mycobacterium kiyosense]GLB88769.1 hypothetical protein SRL2020130_15860 [Mycobacterium kiyosense]GLB96372.1 hypothetical protein SRL2020226_31480 [Mycobacterium kiyosense]